MHPAVAAVQHSMLSSYRDRYVRNGAASCLSVKIDYSGEQRILNFYRRELFAVSFNLCTANISLMYLGSELACMDKPLGCYL